MLSSIVRANVARTISCQLLWGLRLSLRANTRSRFQAMWGNQLFIIISVRLRFHLGSIGFDSGSIWAQSGIDAG